MLAKCESRKPAVSCEIENLRVSEVAFAVGYDGAHRVVQRQGFVFRVRS